MPRPGPRPYECVKRAWHSDRHQPIRGSIIQQIFRLAMDAHAATTRKNKECQEKLPVVVLKAEEIMYSKANSEEEYTNPETLWTRVNDAIDTIIRRDESTETGQLLPPCVEAALNLGCIPVRASRSQRHSNPRTYLPPRIQEPLAAAPRKVDRTINEPYFHCASHKSGKPSYTPKASTPVDVSNSGATESNKFIAPRGYPFLHESTQVGHNQLARLETSAPVKLGSVYPLYYGINHQTKQLDLGMRVTEQMNGTRIIVGMPVGVSVMGQSKKAGSRDLFPFSAGLTCRETEQVTLKGIPEEPANMACDLSLRLGPSSQPCSRISENLTFEDVGCSNIGDGRFTQPYLGGNKELCFFPGMKKNDIFKSDTSHWFSYSEGQNSDVRIRKRKAIPRDAP